MIQPPADASRFDLHTHSTRSDGRFAPEEVLEMAVAGGLDVISLTDHDLPSAVAPGVHLVGERQITVIGGAEISGVHEGREYHLLVYFPSEIPTAFRDFCRDQARARAERYDHAVRSIGLPDVRPPDDAARAGDRSITRLHLAHALVEAGHVPNSRDAFSRYLSGSHGHVPPIGIPLVEVIRTCRSLGGITSWAHPPISRLDFLDSFVSAGLQGIEGLRPYTSAGHRKAYRKAARRHGLFLTGGSDWHGWHDRCDLGLFAVERRDLDGFFEALEQAA